MGEEAVVAFGMNSQSASETLSIRNRIELIALLRLISYIAYGSGCRQILLSRFGLCLDWHSSNILLSFTVA